MFRARYCLELTLAIQETDHRPAALTVLRMVLTAQAADVWWLLALAGLALGSWWTRTGGAAAK